MTTTNAERQAAFKEKMRAAGLKQITLWIHPEDESRVREFNKKGKSDDVKSNKI
jgi:molybdenum cofactor biosynthesis enzyme MoaA